jgi:hypothetical protein
VKRHKGISIPVAKMKTPNSTKSSSGKSWPHKHHEKRVSGGPYKGKVRV